eukprot:TRINITY_DN54698_c0_g1_i1.p1 TRINITY_DN54698_c0_g1~~TRINITY_DN54698_c0_g1_i1.p1  ORF type:complete len:270 (-),score=8.11 TRINITY_DN54698_c0_g1_i1:247-990(-)
MTNCQSQKLKVLYIHGIGGSKQGSFEQKVHIPFLDRKYDLSWINMHTGIKELGFRNSVLRCVLRDIFVICPLLVAGIGAWFSARKSCWRTSLSWLIGGIGSVALFSDGIRQRALMRQLQNAADMQRVQLAEIKPDVIVGFSLGGAVCTKLMAEGFYTGPALLIAPAVMKWPSMCPSYLNWKEAMVIPKALRNNVIVVQGKQDPICTPGPVREWCEHQDIAIRMLDGVDHLVPMCEEVEDAIRQLSSR